MYFKSVTIEITMCRKILQNLVSTALAEIIFKHGFYQQIVFRIQ
jgi:hypothetical protein